ncbi:MAG: hypothetical protein EXS36_16220 [Pedosphaera sp.]|nr:hypothetical protein [Pedosphaera sp.]
MTLLPVAARELIVAARRPATFHTRMGIALLGIAVGFLVLLTGSIRGFQGDIGGLLFIWISGGAFLFCLFAGAFLTSDSLSEEKREGTLGLLFLTDLHGYDIVAGKLLGGGLNALCGVLAALPVLALSWTLGGVTNGEFWRVAIALVNTLFVSLAVGLWVSSGMRSEIQSLTRTAMALLLLAAVPVFLGRLPVNWHLTFIGIRILSPLTLFWHAYARLYEVAGNAEIYWLSLAATHGVAWLLLVRSGCTIPNRWQDNPGNRTPGFGDSPRSRIRESLLRQNPMLALAVRMNPLNRYVWLSVAGALAMEGAVLTAGSPASATGLVVYSFSWYFLLLAPLKILFAWQSCRLFSSFRRDGTMELLLTTPLTDYHVIQGQLRALHRTYMLPVTFWFVAALALPIILGLLANGLVQFYQSGAFASVPIVWAGVGWTMLNLWIDLRTIAWVGFWRALTERKPSSAFSRTVLAVIILPHVLFCVPSLITNSIQLSWARGRFYVNLRAILQGIRDPFRPAPFG